MKFSLACSMKRYRYPLLALLSALLIACTASWSPSQAQLQPEQARSADSFVNSIGVATHLRYVDTAYGSYDTIIRPKLQELGVRHIRDGGKNSEFYRRLNDLATLGIKSTLVMDSRDGITPANVVAEAIQPVLSSIEAVEGPNEWDVNPQATYKNQAFPEGLRAYQDELYAAVKADPTTAALPVLMPSLAIPYYAPRLGSLASADLGNMHSYAGGNLPSQDLDTKWVPLTQAVTGVAKPIVATECGWHNATSDLKASQPGISELAAAKYVPRLYLEYFNRGIQRSFLYELINERQGTTQEQNFGLLRNNGSAKPAFDSLKNLIALLKDPGSEFAPQALSYSLSGSSGPLSPAVHHTLLQKRDGRFYLALWQEVSSFDLQTKLDVYVPQQTVTVTLGTRVRQATTYKPLASVAPVQRYANPKQLNLTISDHPLVIELVPA
ncbi:hypothetical protein [Trichocoleus sp. FACHB-262]|uniref:hypothetical protein n=1 Tax=Trichocoleus sp. FACHB-262 TaxID=2692869 RepID=UPI001686DB5F|nr:hypothetical protein [Trichocoleus sp. FACHB-262]MBD2122623.1 hypothetical protein [Trichocoleus sp. FACHB-262]